ncbi:hypothetical protein Ahy_B01g057113 [Arachis hypogaea]|uniref:FAR1 domain-containing protein n=1 Tax=Arachis hypogaea TaxID=3818 RepID=A0A445B0C0_ARAHY|nr:hypothetical protein Ahy_B01g057113 [Arachis hypogaea]
MSPSTQKNENRIRSSYRITTKTSVAQYDIISVSHRKLLFYPSPTVVGLSSHRRHRPHRPSSSTTYPLFVRYAWHRNNPDIQRGQRVAVCFFFSMSTSQLKGVSSVLALPPPSPRSSLMKCNVAEPVVSVPSSGSNEISSNPNENVDDPLVVEVEQSTKDTQLSDITEVGSDELWDHGCLEKDEMPRVGMRFAQLQLAHDFYVIYAKKVGFATKIKMTTFDKSTKEPVNQAIHCNRDRIRGSRVKAPTRKNPISAAGCKARIYVKFDKEKQEWLFLGVAKRVELGRTGPLCHP